MTAASVSSSYISPNDPRLNEIQPDSSSPAYWRDCGTFVRELKRCAAGCGRYVLVSRTRCHNVYMCNNCGSARMRSWLWIQQRDPEALRSEAQTGVEVTLPRTGTLAEDDNHIRVLALRFAKRVGASFCGMPVLDPRSPVVTMRFMLHRRANWHLLNRLWATITSGKGTLTLRHYSPSPDACYMEFVQWVFRGTEPLSKLTEAERLEILAAFKGSRRLHSLGDFYSPLPVDEQRQRREDYQNAKAADLCPCCKTPLEAIPLEDQEALTIERMQEKHRDKVIAYIEDYNPFHLRRSKDPSIRAHRNIFSAGTTKGAIAAPSPPS